MASIVQLGPDDFGLYHARRSFAYPRYEKGKSLNSGPAVNTPLYARGTLDWVLERRLDRRFQEA